MTDLPDELHRHFRGLHELDERVNALQQEVDDGCMAQLRCIAEKQKEQAKGGGKRQKVKEKQQDPVLTEKIEEMMNEIIKISEEKMKRAQQIYDMVDQHIRKLDKDLKSFGAEVQKDRVRLGVEAPKGNNVVVNKRKKSQVVAQGVADEAKSPEKLYQEALAVADVNEPKYCYCKRISFGEMIACEHPECPIEWFHFGCVGLTPENRPKGQWFCKECKALLEKEKEKQ